MPGWGRCRSQPLLEANVTYIKPFAFSDEAGEAHFLHLPTASLETVSTPADIHSMMLLLYLFGVIASTATVGGIPVDWDEGEFRVEGFLPNDTPVDSNANDLPPYVYPADLNPDPLNRMRDEANVDSFRPIADEPNIETTNPPAKEPNNEPTNDANSQLSDSPLTNLIGKSPIPYILILGVGILILYDSDYDNSVTLSSSCNQFFGLACCTGNSYEAINVASGEALHLQDVSGCTPRRRPFNSLFNT